MATPAPLSRDEVDVALAGLVEAHDRISAAMYALDAHPGLAVLRREDLRGRTGEVAAATLAEVGVLWSQFTGLGCVLDQVKAVRGARSRPGDTELRELGVLLHDPVLPLAPDGAVIDDVRAGMPAGWVTVTALVRRLELAGAELASTLDHVQSAYAELADRFQPLAEALDRARAAATALGHGDTASDVDSLAARLAEATFDSACDPLDAPGPPPRLVAEIEAAIARLAGWAGLRDAYPDRVRQLRADLEEVATAEAEVVRAYAVANEKIASPGLPPAPDAAPALRAHLAQLDQLHRERRWPRLADEMSIVEQSVARARERAAHLRLAADGLLHRRAELRGRLDAYRARAARMGLAEHAEVGQRHRTARDLLYTSPCDLPAATRAVVAYQRYLNELTERGHP